MTPNALCNTLIAFLVVSASSLPAPGAHAAVLCATRTRTVKLREACKRKETQIDPVALGLRGPPGPTCATALSDVTVVSVISDLTPGDQKTASAMCPPGTTLIGGGAWTGAPVIDNFHPIPEGRLYVSAPISVNSTVWYAAATVPSDYSSLRGIGNFTRAVPS